MSVFSGFMRVLHVKQGDSSGRAAALNHFLSKRHKGQAAFGGRVAYVGITQGELSFPHAPLLHRRELSVLASRNALSSDFGRIIGDIEAGRIDTAPWITHRLSWTELPAAFPQ